LSLHAFLLILILLSLFNVTHAQSNENKEKEELSDLEASLIYGFNSTKLYLKGYDPKAGMRHFVGVQIERNFSERFSLGLSFARSNRASYVSNVEIEKTGMDFNVFSKYKIGDFSIFGGLQLVSGGTKIEHPAPYFDLMVEVGDQINPVIGLDVKMAYRLNLYFNSNIKIAKQNERNWQIGVRYNVTKKRKEPSYRRIKRLHAIEDIDALKEGNVLVRLKTAQPKIDALRKAGRAAKANQVAEKQLQENRDIIIAFRREFNFTDFYFFYSHHSKAVRNNKLKNIFLNDDLELDSSIEADESKASYIIEMTNIEPDTNQVFAHYTNRTTGSFEQQRVPTYHGSPNHSFQAFVIKNQNFEQLLRPFPYYSRFILPSLRKHPEQLLFIGPLVVPLLSATTYEASIRNLNEKLHRFHKARDHKVNNWYKRPFEFYAPYLPKEFNSPF
jgi:hypothetical protein